MNVNEFQNKYSNLISNFKRETGSNAIWANEITITFINYLKKEKNIKINYKSPKLLIPKRYNHISEFWLKFLWKNSYFTKKRVIEVYILEYKPPKNEYTIIKRDFTVLIRYFLKYSIVKHFSTYTYKINKQLVSQYRKNY